MRSRIREIQKLKERPAGYSDEWYTPPTLVQALGKFDLDPCAGPMNHAKTNYREDGLGKPWKGRVWCNPPFSDPEPWIRRMESHGNGILLVSANVKTAWLRAALKKTGGVMIPNKQPNFARPGLKPSGIWTGVVLLAYGSKNVAALRESKLGIVMVLLPDLTADFTAQ